MFLLIPLRRLQNSQTILPLHSTMFLLIQHTEMMYDDTHSTLHSTMFLLIQSSNQGRCTLYFSLHSTMFLLILRSIREPNGPSTSFTFHNVSINTSTKMVNGGIIALPLHSTMFLLIRRNEPACICSKQLYIPQCFY